MKISKLLKDSPTSFIHMLAAGFLLASSAAVRAEEYDPATKVHVDGLWLRVHAEDCPALILKEEKKTMTLGEADKAGYRIGVSGQSGRENCCFKGYQRKHPQKELTDDTILCGNNEKRNVKHVAGCHRYWPDRSDLRRPLKDWVADGFKVCPHCRERGPAASTISDEEWGKLGPPGNFTAPSGWVPKAFHPDRLPSPEELEILIQETLSKGAAIQELPFVDPVASMENFMTMRFFFPVHQWLNLYMAYRVTGDSRIRDTLLVSARHYHKLSVEHPSVGQLKAGVPEGFAYMFSMAASARITLQMARKRPDLVSRDELVEAEDFLRTMAMILKPTCEGDGSALDPDMGVPKALADDFRTRAFNRSMNGIGTLGIFTAALEDLQAIKKNKAFQPMIDHYQKVVKEYLEYWFSQGHICPETRGFYYPYKPENGKARMEEGHPVFRRPEDAGHYSHTLQGVVFLYESAPELGVDDEFMTAVANALHHNSTTKIVRQGRSVLSGHVECPVMSKVRPYGKRNDKHQYSPARERFYVLQAFRDDLIDGLCASLNETRKQAANSEYDKRLATRYAQYVKALRKDRRLIHLVGNPR
ncbi:MAG: hypothetical protein KDN05_12250 [Verrucomicrobiae bacterium]|nr:hypothetical protein [Verrucomicrobiae bacterium]